MRHATTAALAVSASLLSGGFSYGGVSTANQPNNQQNVSQAAGGTGAIPPSFNPGAGWVYGQRPHGRPVGARYWYTPDFVRVYKIRGGGGNNFRQGAEASRREVLPLLSWNLKSWNESANTGLEDFTAVSLSKNPRRGSELRGVTLGVRLNGGWSNVPEFEGWGKDIPYRGLSEGLTSRLLADDVMRDTGIRDISGTLTDKPFDGGITRYELWLGKKASTTRDQQGNIGGWGHVAWFFDSYNVVNQAGQVLGTLRTETADSENQAVRAFRNSPYLVEANETPLINRTFTASQEGGKVQLRELPKMLVLLSPSAANRQDYSQMAVQTGGAAGAQTRKTGRRTYGPLDPAVGAAGSVMKSDRDNPLAPNSSVDEKTAGEGQESGISTHWEKTRVGSKDGWTFRRWQRAENLFTTDARNPAWHKWVLETKSDLLYAPAGEGGNSITIKAENLESLPQMIVGQADVQAFDTGGFVVGAGGALASNAAVFGDPDDITDSDIITVLPIGRFYPRSAVYVAVEYRLLDENGNPEGGTAGSPNDWSRAKTAALFYWNSDGGVQVVKDTVLSQQSVEAGNDSLTPRRVKFVGSGTFDPYSDAWVVSVRDLAHTSAQYRLRIFMGLPFKPINSGPIMPAGQGAGRPGTMTSINQSFNSDHLAGILLANQKQPIRYSSTKTPNVESFEFHDPLYQTLCRRAGLGNPDSFTPLSAVQRVSADVVEKVVTGADKGMRTRAGLANSSDKWRNPWYSGNSTDFAVEWFEFSNGNGAKTWTVNVPEVWIGVDDEAAGVIITE